MARYSTTLRDQNGAPIDGALVSVTNALTNIQAVLEDDYGQPLDNPFVTGEYGEVVFNTAAGSYKIAYNYGGRTVLTEVTPVGTLIANLTPDPAHAGMFFALDADGNATYSVGTGADNGLRTDLAASSGSALSGFLQAGTGAVARSTQAELRDWVKPQQFGAVGDGVADDTLPIQRAITRAGTYGRIYFIPGAYKISGTLDLLEGQTIEGNGARITTTSATLTMIRVSGAGYVSIRNLRLAGPRVAETSGTGIGLLLNESVRYKIEGATIENIVGIGFKVTGASAPTHRGEQGQFSDCAAFECVTGRSCVAGSLAEYTTWSNFNAAGNVVGIEDSAGNTVQTGGSVSNNVTGVKITNGANSGHGMFAAININHNTDYNLYCSGVYNGHNFTGCHFYDGDIAIIDSSGIILDGGDFDPGPVYNRGAVYTASISGNTMTVTGTPTGLPIAVAQQVFAPGVAAGTEITALGTGTGGAGTYTVNNSQTVTSRVM